jgi:hypothetical protein
MQPARRKRGATSRTNFTPAIAGKLSPAASSASVSALSTSASVPKRSSSSPTNDSTSACGLLVKQHHLEQFVIREVFSASFD